MDMFGLSGASGGVTITDLTIDGNKDGNPSAGRYSLGAAGVQAVGVRKLTIQRTRWINAYLAAIGLFVNQGQYVADTMVADSDFENNGRGTTFTSDQLCNSGDMAMRAPLRVKVVHNRSNNAQGNFVCFGTNANAGVGDVVVSDNVVRNAAGFGIALGGISGKGAVLSHNTLDQPPAAKAILTSRCGPTLPLSTTTSSEAPRASNTDVPALAMRLQRSVSSLPGIRWQKVFREVCVSALAGAI
jgi:hypothetical protein